METIVDLSWRAYPALVMMALGLGIFVHGSMKANRGFSAATHEPTRIQDFVVGFRIAVIGLTLLGLGIAWNWHVLWLFVLTAVFAGEEILESTTHLAILRWKPKPYRAPASVEQGQV